MTTATKNGWTKFDNQHLSPGDEVRLSHFSRKVAGKIGIVERKLQKNISVIVDGISWRIPPSLIDEYRDGDADNLPAAKNAVVECDQKGLRFCKPGDPALMYRGAFDVVRIVSINPLRCEVLGRRGKGKIYVYKPDMFVQKLDPSKFSS